MKLMIIIIVIVCVLLLTLLTSSVDCSHAKLMFIVPKNAQQEQQLNNNLKSIFQANKLVHGWHVEANVKTSFYFFIHTSMPIISHKQVYYIFFTLNSSSCDDYMNYTYLPISIQYKHTHALKKMHRIEIEFSLKHALSASYYICFSRNNEEDNNNELSFDHQGSQLALTTYESMCPLSVKLIFYAVLVLLNATFNGLNLGLMSLSVEELKLIIKTSESASKRQCAINILPLRKKRKFSSLFNTPFSYDDFSLIRSHSRRFDSGLFGWPHFNVYFVHHWRNNTASFILQISARDRLIYSQADAIFYFYNDAAQFSIESDR